MVSISSSGTASSVKACVVPAVRMVSTTVLSALASSAKALTEPQTSIDTKRARTRISEVTVRAVFFILIILSSCRVSAGFMIKNKAESELKEL